jgi:hypothetical protein
MPSGPGPHAAPTASSAELNLVDRPDPRRAALDHWGAALARGDHAEVERLVRQSRIDREWTAASGQLGSMLG